MAVSETDYKILWGRAAGRCSNPGCRVDLTVIVGNPGAYHVGEMAHIIAKKPSGPRGQESGGSDTYENLVLLCPTCHRRVDKAPPGEYPEALLQRWKRNHEEEIRNLGRNEKFESLSALKKAVSRILSENHILWRTFGPESEAARCDPGSNLYAVWNLRKGDTIIPNNHRIINTVEANAELLPDRESQAFLMFKNHAIAFQDHWADRLDSYPRFPPSFEENFRP